MICWDVDTWDVSTLGWYVNNVVPIHHLKRSIGISMKNAPSDLPVISDSDGLITCVRGVVSRTYVYSRG